MTEKLFPEYQETPLVYFFGDPDSLGLSIINNLLSHFCKVKVLTGNTNTWEEKTVFLKDNNLLEIADLNDLVEENFYSRYLIFANTNLNRSDREINKAISISRGVVNKKFMLLPYSTVDGQEKERLKQIRKLFQNELPDAELFYIGDMLGPGIGDQEKNLAYVLLRDVYLTREVPSTGEGYLYPVLSSEVAKSIIRSLLSFGPSSNEIALVGQRVPQSHYLRSIRNYCQDCSDTLIKIVPERFEVEVNELVILPSNMDLAIKETLKWFNANPPKIQKVEYKKEPWFPSITPPKFSAIKFPKFKFPVRHTKTKSKPVFRTGPKIKLKTKMIVAVIALVLAVFLSPIILLVASGGAIALSFYGINKGNISLARISSSVSSYLAQVSAKETRAFSFLPVIGKVYSSILFIPQTLYKANVVGGKLITIYPSLKKLPTQIMGNEVYSISEVANKVSLEFDSAYRDLGFLQGEIDALALSKKTLIYNYISRNNLNMLRDRLLLGKTIADNLPSFLGVDKPKTYLLLFQNNMELRPTGGFIGSFALVTFDSGRLTDLNVQDVYAADGQLKGHVEPPEAIKKYLGEAGWYLRDSNWDPDFPSSAKKAEWFLEKEIGKSVEGVVGIDLNVVKDFLQITGPVYLADYNQTVDYKNIYEKTQAEVEKEFFPGSYRKTGFLTALSRLLIARVQSGVGEKETAIIKNLGRNLLEKHIQIYLHNQPVQNALAQNGFDGGVDLTQCSDNCYSDFFGMVDANVGVNKSNYFLKRSANLAISVGKDVVKKSLNVTFENTANPVLGMGVRYKSYFRIIVPVNSLANEVVISSPGSEIKVPLEEKTYGTYKELGLSFEVIPGEKKSLKFTWNNLLPSGLDFAKSGEYRLTVRKQAGTAADPFSLTIVSPTGVIIYHDPILSLTKDGNFVYNTLLTRDIFPRIYW